MVVSAIIIALLIYSGALGIRQVDKFFSIFNHEEITRIDGRIVSNPSKTVSEKFYSMQVVTEKVYSKNGSSESHGIINILIPSQIVELLYPGKLFSNKFESAHSSVTLIEKGLLFHAQVSYLKSELNSDNKNGIFIASSVTERGWENYVAKIRAKYRIEFKRLLYAWGDAGGLLLALISGSREYTNQDVSEGFKNAGLSHILALSGMHLSLFSVIALHLGRIFGSKKSSTIFSICAVILFVWFAGLSPSLLRALLCTLISVMLHFCSLPGISGSPEIVYRVIKPTCNNIRLVRIISLSFLIHVCLYPNDAFSVAFMLSYAALLGIVIFESILNGTLVRYFPGSIASAFSASIGAQLFTAPITLFLFGTIMPIGIVSSVIVSPYASFFLIIGLFSIALCLVFPFLLYPIGGIIQILYYILENIVLWFSKFPHISI